MTMTLSIDALKRNFFLNESAYWWAYDAFSRTKLIAKFRDDDDSLDEDGVMEYSWLQLEELFESYDAGEVNVILKKNPSDNTKNALTYRVKWGSGISGTRQSSTVQRNGFSGGGGNGTNMFQMMQMMMEMNNTHHRAVLDQTQSLAELRYENMRLEEALESDSAPSSKEKIIEEIGSIARVVFGGNAENRPQASSLGTMGEKNKTEEKVKMDPNAIINDCIKLQQLIPEYHINEVIKSLVAFAETNPTQVKFFIGTMVKK